MIYSDGMKLLCSSALREGMERKHIFCEPTSEQEFPKTSGWITMPKTNLEIFVIERGVTELHTSALWTSNAVLWYCLTVLAKYGLFII